MFVQLKSERLTGLGRFAALESSFFADIWPIVRFMPETRVSVWYYYHCNVDHKSFYHAMVQNVRQRQKCKHNRGFRQRQRELKFSDCTYAD